MDFSSKIIATVFFLLSIPLFRAVYVYMHKNILNGLTKRNPKIVSFYVQLAKINKFIIFYIIPIAIIYVIVTLWLN